MEESRKRSLNLFAPSEAKKTKLCKKKEESDAVESILTYDVLRILFKYLSSKDLYSVSTICRAWRDAANSEAETRQHPEYFLKNFRLPFSDNEDDDNPKSLKNDLRIVPSLGFTFVTGTDEQWFMNGCCCESLPRGCNSLVLGGYDIVANYDIIDEDSGICPCAFLPKIPALKHKLYYGDSHTFEGVSNVEITAHINKLVKNLLPSKNEKSKCIIMLSNTGGYYFIGAVMTELQKRYQPGTIALCGAICENMKLCEGTDSLPKCSRHVQWAAITFSSPSLQYWSLTLLHSCRSEALINEKLKKFKENIELKKHAFGFMFACCERISNKELEIATFKEHFPTVPLFGLHGEGEYGVNTLDKTTKESATSVLNSISDFNISISLGYGAITINNRAILN